MNKITTNMSDEELIHIGQAMKKNGFSDVKAYLRWAANQQAAAILAEK